MNRLAASVSRSLCMARGVRSFAGKASPLPDMTNLKNLNEPARTQQSKKKKKNARTDHLNWTPRMLMVTLSGQDTPGLPNRLFSVVDKFNGSVQSNRMTTMGRSFTVSMLTAIPDFHNTADFEREVQDEFPDFKLGVQETQPTPLFGPSLIYLYLNAEGADGPGILTMIADIVDRHDITVKDITSDVHQAPFTGYRIMTAKFLIGAHSQMDFEEFQADLESFQGETGFDIQLRPASDKDAKMVEEMSKQEPGGEEEEEEDDARRSVDARFTDVTR